MSYPATIDSPQGTTAAGTSLLATIDHALDHRTLGSAIVAIENKIGINSGSASANQLLVGQGAGSTSWQQVWNNGTLGTAVLQSPTIQGQGTNSGTIANGVYGTATYQGGTANNQVVGTPSIIGGTHNSAVFGTPAIIGGTVGSTSVLNPLQSAFFYQGSITLTTGTIPFANKGIDVLSEYNGTQFVAIQSGVYEFFTQLSLSGNPSDFNLEIHYNGTTMITQRCNPNGFGIPAMWMGSVTAGGTVVAYSNGGTGAIGTSSYFWGKRLF